MYNKAIVGGFISTMALLVGGWDKALQVLLILMTLDVISGVFKALNSGKFTSKEFRNGLMQKAGFFIVIILAFQLDVMLGQADVMPVRTVTCLFYIGVEGSSLIENLGQIGVPIPKAIANRLARLKEKGEEEIIEGDE